MKYCVHGRICVMSFYKMACLLGVILPHHLSLSLSLPHFIYIHYVKRPLLKMWSAHTTWWNKTPISMAPFFCTWILLTWKAFNAKTQFSLRTNIALHFRLGFFIYHFIGKFILLLVIFVSFAFPSVPHDALLWVCESYGFSNNAVELIKSIGWLTFLPLICSILCPQFFHFH